MPEQNDTAFDHLIGKKVIAKSKKFTFVGTLRHAQEVAVPGALEVVTPDGNVDFGGLPLVFDSIEELPEHPAEERCYYCATDAEMEAAMEGRPHPTIHMNLPEAACPTA